MIVSLDRLTDQEIRRAVERVTKRQPEVTISERGDGFVRADVACYGTCGAREFHDGVHDVVLRWDHIATCSCPAVHGVCYHIGSLWAHEGGALPDPPKTCEAYGCGGQLMYWDGGNGHAAQCPRYGDPEDVYERPQSETAKRIAAGALKGNVVPLESGRQKLVDKTRPTIRMDDGDILVLRPCGCVAISIDTRDIKGLDEGFGAVLPLSPFEGCPLPEHYDHMYPPAPDQVRARQEAQ